MTELQEPISVRRALACGAATLVAYVGVVHEVVGSTLYPQGPAALGGPLGWHALGISGIAAGLALAAGVLGLARVPVLTLGRRRPLRRGHLHRRGAHPRGVPLLRPDAVRRCSRARNRGTQTGGARR